MSVDLNKKVAAIYSHRYMSSVEWSSNNHILLQGEMGIESDTNKFKFGNGTSGWNSLPYASGYLAEILTKGAGAFSLAHVKSVSATNEGSISLGLDTLSTGRYSFAIGSGTEASNNHAFASGCSTKATGPQSSAEGYLTQAIKDQAHAEGCQTIAGGTEKGIAAHSEGIGTIAEGDAAHAQGKFTKATGDASAVNGYWTVAESAHQFVIGRVNDNNALNLFEIGGGAVYQRTQGEVKPEDTSLFDKFNIFEVSHDGQARAESFCTKSTIINRNTWKNIGENPVRMSVLPGAIVSGIQSVAFGGQRFDKAGQPTNEAELAKAREEAAAAGKTDTEINAIKIQPRTQVIGNQSFAAGGGCIVNGDWSVAFGKESITYQKSAVAIGGGNVAGLTRDDFINKNYPVYASDYKDNLDDKNYSNTYSFAFAVGDSNRAFGRTSIALGRQNCTYGIWSIGMGNENITQGESSISLGYQNIAKGNYSVTIGANLRAVGEGAVATGRSSYEIKANYTASKISQDEIVSLTTFDNYEALKTKWDARPFNIAYGKASHTEGEDTVAFGYMAHAEGYQTHAIGNYSHSEGYLTFAKGNCSHAGGEGAEAGMYSFAHGSYAKATGSYSVAFGGVTTASGNYSMAIGINCEAKASYSFIGGSGSVSNMAGSFVYGQGLKAEGKISNYGAVFGQYNYIPTTGASLIFSVGTGVNTSSVKRRQTTFAIDNGGKILIRYESKMYSLVEILKNLNAFNGATQICDAQGSTI